MRRVLIFRELLLPPSETFVLEQASALRRYQPVFCGLVDVPHSLPVPESILLTERSELFSRYRLELYRRLQRSSGFHGRVRQVAPQLIHSHFALDGADAMGLQRDLGIPMVVTLHGFDVSSTDKSLATNRGGRRFLKRRPSLWKAASRFVCVSNAIRKLALEAGYPQEKLKVRYTGIDCEKFPVIDAARREKNLILFVGRLVEKKGCEYAIRAVAELQRHRSVRLAVIGDGPLREELQQLAGRLGASVEFMGVQPPDVVRVWMQRAWLLCNPSVTAANGDTEGLGMVFAEAQATGLPVVSTRHGGIPEVVRDNETGFLAQERSVEGLVRHAERLLADQQLWAASSGRAANWIREQFDIRRCTAGLEEVYDEAIAASRA